MEERFVPPVANEARPIAGTGVPPVAPAADALEDPRALQILTTEHWSLLTARSLVYNEAFARSGMFLSFLSATLLVLGLISTATGFSDAFLVIAAIFLALDLFVGLTTLGRILAAGDEDIRYLQGMNRMRNAYHTMVPGLEGYFITGRYDDLESTVSTYGPAESSPLRDLVHGFTTAPAMISVIICAVLAALVAVLAMLVTRDGAVAGVIGGLVFLVAVAVATLLLWRAVESFMKSLEVRFPPPPNDSGGDR